MFPSLKTCSFALLIALCVSIIAADRVFADKVPHKIYTCLNDGIAALMKANTKSDKREIFDSYTEPEILGQFLYPDRVKGWAHFDPVKKRRGIDYFFEQIYGLTRKSKNELRRESLRLDNADLRQTMRKYLGGVYRTVYQVVIRLTDGTARTSFAVLVTDSCTVIDVMQGPSLAKSISYEELEIIPQQPHSRAAVFTVSAVT